MMSSLPRKKATSNSFSKLNNRLSTGSASSITKKLTKPAWDSTHTNLVQYKQTPDELEKRKQTHQSKNIEQIRNEKQRQSILKAKKTASSLDTKTQLAILKEILLDDDQLKKLLLKSEETLKNASNLIGNEPEFNNKRSAKINFTLAPNADLNESNLPIDTISKKFAIKQQPRKQEGANFKSVNSSMSYNSDGENEQPDINDLVKYRQFLIEKKALIEAAQKKKQIDNKELRNLNELDRYINNELNDKKLFKIFDNQPINDTPKVHRIESTITNEIQQNSGRNTQQTATLNLNDFKKALEELENQLIEYEEQTGRQLSAQRMSKHDTYSSYTISLVNVVASLLHHLKQTTFELQFEKQKLSETTKQLDIHRKLIDGLTTEILSVKAQNEKYFNEFVNYEAKIEAQIDQIKLMLKISTSDRPIENLKKNNQNFKKQNLQQQQQQSNINTRISSLTSHNSPSNSSQLNEYDHFSERLNAMLQTDIIPGSSIQQISSNSQLNSARSSINHHQNSNKLFGFDSGQNYIQQTIETNNSRPTSSNGLLMNSNNQYITPNMNSLLNTNKHIINDFNSQIHDLNVKNYEAQQKLKTLHYQQQQQQYGSQIENEFVAKFPDTMQRLDNIDNHQTLNKLKEDQKLLREQIYLLNKQRELAQSELDIIVSNNASTTTVASLTNLNSIGISISNGVNRSSPNLSPIPTENIFTNPLETKNTKNSKSQQMQPNNQTESVLSARNTNKKT